MNLRCPKCGWKTTTDKHPGGPDARLCGPCATNGSNVIMVGPLGDPELDNLLAKAIAAYNALTPEQRAAYDEARRQSFARGNNWGNEESDAFKGRGSSSTITTIAPEEPHGTRCVSLVSEQAPPKANDSPSVWDEVIADIESDRCTEDCSLLLTDMRERDRIGRERYGTPLQRDNGRDALIDAYQEALDAVVYCKAANSAYYGIALILAFNLRQEILIRDGK